MSVFVFSYVLASASDEGNNNRKCFYDKIEG